jgi:hypothetical protein
LLLSLVTDQESELVLTEPDQEAAEAVNIIVARIIMLIVAFI